MRTFSLCFSKIGVSLILKRKLITASITCTIYTVFLGLILPLSDLLGDGSTNYWVSASTSISAYFLYTAPSIFIYGLGTSIVSDRIGAFFEKKTGEKRFGWGISLLLHLLFGLVLFLVSLPASLLFFFIDQLLLKRNSSFKWFHSIQSVAVPIFIWVTTMSYSWLVG